MIETCTSYNDLGSFVARPPTEAVASEINTTSKTELYCISHHN